MEMSSTLTAVLRRVRHSRMFFPPEGFGRISLRLKRESRRKSGLDPRTHSTWLRVVVSSVEPRLKHSGVTVLESHLFTQPQFSKRSHLADWRDKSDGPGRHLSPCEEQIR